MGNLHWTLNYTHQTIVWDFEAEFSQTLAAALASAPIDKDAEKKIHRYELLPNFWAGFKRDPVHKQPKLC